MFSVNSILFVRHTLYVQMIDFRVVYIHELLIYNIRLTQLYSKWLIVIIKCNREKKIPNLQNQNPLWIIKIFSMRYKYLTRWIIIIILIVFLVWYVMTARYSINEQIFTIRHLKIFSKHCGFLSKTVADLFHSTVASCHWCFYHGCGIYWRRNVLYYSQTNVVQSNTIITLLSFVLIVPKNDRKMIEMYLYRRRTPTYCLLSFSESV